MEPIEALSAGSYITVEADEPGNPESALSAYLIDTDGNDFQLCITWPEQERDYFWWMLRSTAAYHQVPLYDDGDVAVDLTSAVMRGLVS